MEPVDYGMDFSGYLPIYPDIKLPIELIDQKIKTQDLLAEKTLEDIDKAFVDNTMPEGPYSRDLAEAHNAEVSKIKDISDAFLNKGLSARETAMRLREFQTNVLNTPEMIEQKEWLKRHGNEATWGLQENAERRNYESGDLGYVYGTTDKGRIQAQTIDQLRSMHPATGGYIARKPDQLEFIDYGLKAIIPQEEFDSKSLGITYVEDAQGNKIPQIANEETARKYFTEALVRQRMSGATLDQFAETWKISNPGYTKARLQGLTPEQEKTVILEDFIAALQGRFFDLKKSDITYKNVPGGKGGKKGNGTDDPEYPNKSRTATEQVIAKNPITKLKAEDITPSNVQTFYTTVGAQKQVAVQKAVAQAQRKYPNAVTFDTDEKGQIQRIVLRPDLNIPGQARAKMQRDIDLLNNQLETELGAMESLEDIYLENMAAAGLDISQSPEEQIMREYQGIGIDRIPEFQKFLKSKLKRDTGFDNQQTVPMQRQNDSLVATALASNNVTTALNILKKQRPDVYKEAVSALMAENPKFKRFAESLKAEIEGLDTYTTATVSLRTPQLHKDLSRSIFDALNVQKEGSIIDLDTGNPLTADEIRKVRNLAVMETKSAEGDAYAWRANMGETLRLAVDPTTGEMIPVMRVIEDSEGKSRNIGFNSISGVRDIAIEDGVGQVEGIDALQQFYKNGAATDFSSSRVGDQYVDIINEGKKSGYRFYVPELDAVFRTSEGMKDLEFVKTMDGLASLRDLGANDETISQFLKDSGIRDLEQDNKMAAYIKQKSIIKGKRWEAETSEANVNAERTGLKEYTPNSKDIKTLLGTEEGGKDPGSTASGYGQFIDSTFLAYLKKEFPQIDAKYDKKEDKLKLKENPQIGRALAASYANDLKQAILDSGVSTRVDPWMLKLAYMFDAKAINIIRDFKKGVKGNVKQYLDADQIKANPGVFKNISTIAELVNWAQVKMGM